jgi:hypothetical protein
VLDPEEGLGDDRRVHRWIVAVGGLESCRVCRVEAPEPAENHPGLSVVVEPGIAPRVIQEEDGGPLWTEGAGALEVIESEDRGKLREAGAEESLPFGAQGIGGAQAR